MVPGASRFVAAGLLVAGAGAAALAQVKPPEEPATIEVSVAPTPVPPGGRAVIRVELTPQVGVKINRYPKIKLEVLSKPGLLEGAETMHGDSEPPPPEKVGSNYFEDLGALQLNVSLDERATAGRHDVEGKLIYFYCVPASGFCAPKRVALKIPLDVR
jgi:hypothetical protein